MMQTASMQGQKSMARALAGPLAGMWRSGRGPSHSALDSTFAMLGIASDTPTDPPTKEKRVLNAVLSSPNDRKTKEIVTELVELLRVERTFEADDDSTHHRLKILRDALAKFDAELTEFGQLYWWSDLPTVKTDIQIHPQQGTGISDSTSVPAYQATQHESPGTHLSSNGTSVNNPKIFVVYGHDHSLRDRVELALRDWGFQGDQIIILDKLPSGGRTLIEKFEQHGQDAAFAIVLGTPDDLGHRKDHPEEVNHRARQNVVLEFGYFLGKLGRHRVAFIDGGIEQPSDIHGLLVINTKDHDWTTRLAREMKAAGLPVDFL